ncbi:hypothetical protein NMU02_10730 [Coprobacter sp. LH1063]|uniref:ACT domain-containing protein n=2 Tax=Coprobacter tertius TaxID=2944915 RepID=A0ABT1MIY5_9BACT|nr:hypothetical protein [Coprobacter tertius]
MTGKTMEIRKIMWQFPLEELIGELNMRSSRHLPSLRKDGDNGEDWTDLYVLSDGEKEWVIKSLQEVFPQVYGALSARLSKTDLITVDENGISMGIIFPVECPDSLTELIRRQIKEVSVTYVLSRWYLIHDANLGTYYAARCDGAMNELRSLLSRVTKTRRPTNYQF